MKHPTNRDSTNMSRSSFTTYLDRLLTRNGWTVDHLCAESELSPTVVFRWRRGYSPDLTNSRKVASAFNVPLLEVLVNAGHLTPEEANADVQLTPDLSTVPTLDLLGELSRRVRPGDNPTALHDHSLGDDLSNTTPG